MGRSDLERDEREQAHDHVCPRCNDEWRHYSRRCNEQENRTCDECELEIDAEERW